MNNPDFEEKDFDALYAYIEDLGVTFPAGDHPDARCRARRCTASTRIELLTKDFRLYDLLHPVIETKLPREIL